MHTEPLLVGGRAWVVPLQSWYHASWDTEPDLTILDVPSPSRVMTDFAACKWPEVRGAAGQEVLLRLCPVCSDIASVSQPCAFAAAGRAP